MIYKITLKNFVHAFEIQGTTTNGSVLWCKVMTGSYYQKFSSPYCFTL